MKRRLHQTLSVCLILLLGLTMLTPPVSLAGEVKASEFKSLFLLTDSENIGATPDRHGIGRTNVTQNNGVAHSGVYSMKYSVAAGQASSMWNSRVDGCPIDIFSFAPTLESVALSFWVYTKDASAEANFTFKLRDSTNASMIFSSLSKTKMAPTANEWHQVILPLTQGERSSNFNWRDITTWALEGSAGVAYELWVDDIGFVSYSVDTKAPLVVLSEGDSALGLGLSEHATVQSDKVHSGSGSIHLQGGLSTATPDESTSPSDPEAESDLVAAIGVVSYRAESLAAIQAAEAAMETLSDSDKAIVTAARAKYDYLARVTRDLQKVYDVDLGTGWSNDGSTKEVIDSTDPVRPGKHIVITPNTTAWSIWNSNTSFDFAGYDFDNLFYGMEIKRTGGVNATVWTTLSNGTQTMATNWWYSTLMPDGEWGFVTVDFPKTQNQSDWSYWSKDTWNTETPLTTFAVRQKKDPANVIEFASIGIYDKTIDIDSLVQAANVVVDQIAALDGTDAEAVAAARTAYDALNDNQKKLVTNSDKLTRMDVSGDSPLVMAIGLVSYRAESLAAIQAAEAAMETLSDSDKAIVTAARAKYDYLARMARDLQKVYDVDLGTGWSNDGSTKEVIDSTDPVRPGKHIVITPNTTAWSVWNSNTSFDFAGYDFDNLFYGMEIKRTGGVDATVWTTLSNGTQTMATNWWYSTRMPDGEWGFVTVEFPKTQNQSDWSYWSKDTWNTEAPLTTFAVRQTSNPADLIEFASIGIYDKTIDINSLVQAANAVVDQIAALDGTDAEAIASARTAYDALNDNQKKLVVNLNELEELDGSSVPERDPAVWCTQVVPSDWSGLARHRNNLALSAWVYTDALTRADDQITFDFDLFSTEKDWRKHKLSLSVTKEELAPNAGTWHQVILPLSRFQEQGSTGDFDWSKVDRWMISQSAGSGEYSLYLDQISLITLEKPVEGMSFVVGETKVELSKPFAALPATLEAFVTVDAETPDNQSVGVILGNTGSDSVPGDGTFRFSIDTFGNPLLVWNGGETTVRFDADLRTGRYTHLAVVHQADTQEFFLYVNGELTDTQTAQISESLSQKPCFIGGDYRAYKEVGNIFEGWLADVRAWSCPRTADDIVANMDKALQGNEDGLLGNWLLNQTPEADEQVADASQNQNHGTLRVKPLWIAPHEAESDFTLVTIPDTQYIIRDHPDLLNPVFQWMADNAESENIQYAMSVGDIVDIGSDDRQWDVAVDAYDLIDGKIPYSLVPGNHDYKNFKDYRETTNYNKFFSAENYTDLTSLKGFYEEGRMENTYHCFSVQGINYMIVALEFMPRDSVLEWANEVIAAHPDHNVIITTHAYLTGTGVREQTIPTGYEMVTQDGNPGEQMWQKLVKKHSNIFMVLCGHVQSKNHDTRYLASVGDNGNTVHQIMANAQFLDQDLKDTDRKVAGLLLLLRFTDFGRTIHLDFYSPVHNEIYREDNCFTINVATEQMRYIGLSGVKDGETYDLGNGVPVLRYETGSVICNGQELPSGYAFTQPGEYTLTVNMYGMESTLTFQVVGELSIDTATQAVIDSINALPEEIALTDKQAVEAARAAYDALTDGQKALVDEDVLAKLIVAEDAIEDLEKAAKEEADKAAAQAVTDIINTLTEESSKEDVAAAREAYEALTEDQKALVTNETLEKLVALEQIPVEPEITYGDVDGNGKVDAADALKALQHAVKLVTLEEDDYTAANVNGDDKIDATDALLMLQYTVKLIDTFPVEKA